MKSGGFDDDFYRKIEESNNLIGMLENRLRQGHTSYHSGETEDSLKEELKQAREIRRNFISKAEDEAFANSGYASQSVIGYNSYRAKGGRRTRRYKKHSNKKRSGHKRLHKKRMSRRR